MSAKHSRAYSDAYETGRLFTLRIPGQYIADPMIIIEAFDGNHTGPHGHRRIELTVRQGGRVIFKLGELYCAVSQWATLDGKEARSLVISCAAMKPGDTGREYFKGYTEAQKEWALANGEHLSLIAEERYGQL